MTHSLRLHCDSDHVGSKPRAQSHFASDLPLRPPMYRIAYPRKCSTLSDALAHDHIHKIKLESTESRVSETVNALSTGKRVKRLPL
ncbi:hypothetical protein NMY22_g1680 [Coprinellus aureogranulatus]|nr:hypothetical protein NMY22_g1680 [Coprinellus aureogranulatus]